MADVEKTIEIIFGAVDKTGNVTRNIARDMNTLGSSVENASQPLENIFDLTSKVALSIAAVGVAAVGFSIHAAVQFEEAMLDLQKVLGENEKLTKADGEAITALSDKYATSAISVVGTIATFKQAGFTIGESFGLADTALKSFVITELSVEEATELLKRALRGFNLEASESGRVLDVVNAISNEYGTNAAELFNALADISPVANQAGISLERMAGLMVPTIEVFGSGTETARAFKTGLLRLGSDTAPVVKALTDIGVFADGTNDAFKNNGEILQRLIEIFPTLTQKHQQFIATEIFGIDQAGKLTQALVQSERGFQAYETAMDSAGSATDEFIIRSAAVGFQVERLAVSFGKLGTSIGNQLLAQFGGLAGSSNDLLKAFRLVVDSGGLAPLFDQMRPMFEEFDKLLADVAENLPGAFAGVNFDRLVASFETLGEEIGGVFGALTDGGLDLSTQNGLTQFLQALIDTGARFVEFSGGIIGSFDEIAEAIGDLAGGAGELSTDFLEGAGALVGFGKQVNVLAGLLPSLGQVIAGAGAAAAAIFGANAIKGALGFETRILSLTGVMGRAGLAGAAAIAGYEIGKIIRDNPDIFPWLNDLGRAIGEFAAQIQIDYEDEQLFPWLGTIGDELDAATSRWSTGARRLFNEVFADNEAISKQLGLDIQGVLDKLEVAPIDVPIEPVFDIAAITEFGDILSGTEYDPFAEWNPDPVIDGLADIAGGVSAATAATNDAEASTVRWVRTVVDGVSTYEQVGGAAQRATDIAADGADKAKEKTEGYHLKLLEIASDERIAFKKLNIELDIEQLKAQASIAKSVLEGIGKGIESTGNVISSLIGDLNGADRRTRHAIESQLRKENENRDASFKLQEKWTNALIQDMRARNRLAAQGVELRFDAGALEARAAAMLEVLLIDSRLFMNENGANALLSCSG